MWGGGPALGELTSQFAMPSTPRTNSRRTAYCFTLNNWTEDELTAIKAIECKYLVIGKETGEEGTPHLQGYIHFNRNVRFSTVKAAIPRAHIETAKGSAAQNATYCKKDGDFVELGLCPMSQGEASKATYAQILAKAEEGDYDWIKANHPRMWIQFSTKLESLRQPSNSILGGELMHEWWVGPTGSGKSSLLWELYPKHFQKDSNKWWCGYRHQPVVAIEEWSPKNECTGSYLKIWADRYPFTGQIKGGSLQRIRPSKLIILSNYEITDCFPDHRDSDPLRRRFTVMRFPEDKAKCRERAVSYADTADGSSCATADADDEGALDEDIRLAFPTPQESEFAAFLSDAVGDPRPSSAIEYMPLDPFSDNIW